MIYAIIGLCAMTIITCAMLVLSARRDVLEVQALYDRLDVLNKKDKKIDAEIVYLETLYGIDDHYERWKQRSNIDRED